MIVLATSRDWISHDGGFILERPGPGSELLCSTVDGTECISDGAVRSMKRT